MPAWLKPALGHNSFPFPEQIGQNSRIGNGYGLNGVGDDKTHSKAVVLALNTACLNHSPNAKRMLFGSFARTNLSWGKKEHKVALKRIKH